MCGIFGYYGQPKPAAYLADRIRSLEYRGYDSAGVAYYQGPSKTRFVKGSGDIATILKNEHVRLDNQQMTMGIAHTRWATHGAPSTRNAHPHEFPNFYLVHNGIIENYETLIKEFNITQRQTETDTEIIGWVLEALIAKNPARPLHEVAIELREKLRGSYACLVMFKNRAEMLTMRYKSPLILGIEDKTGNVLLSSDMHGFGAFEGRVYQLNDREFVVTTDGALSFYNGDRTFEPVFSQVSLKEDDSPQTHECFFLKEIYEQPHLFSDDLNTHHQRQIQAKLKGVKAPNHAQLIACGSAYHAALYAKIAMDRFQQFTAETHFASEFRYRKTPAVDNEWHLFVSQSGETADTLECARISKTAGRARLFSITNHAVNSLSRLTDNNIAMSCGAEISVAATKTFTAQLKVLTMMAHHIAGAGADCGLDAFPDFFAGLTQLHERVKPHATRAAAAKTLVYLGKDVLLPIAMEGALKIKEIAYVHAEAFASGEIKHGPLALIDEDACTIVLVSKDFYPEKVVNAVHEVKSRGSQLLIITDSPAIHAMDAASSILLEHRVPYAMCGIPFTLPLQLLAYEVAKLKGVNIDRPRNLAKSVTVE